MIEKHQDSPALILRVPFVNIEMPIIMF